MTKISPMRSPLVANQFVLGQFELRINALKKNFIYNILIYNNIDFFPLSNLPV
jgi:hypothetical protein